MVFITADVAKNRLIIEFKGAPDLQRVSAAEATLRAEIDRLRAPFDVLSDVSALGPGLEPEQLEPFAELLRQARVRRVVRVVGRCAHGALLLERLGRRLKHSAHLAFSRGEAEALLDRPWEQPHMKL